MSPCFVSKHCEKGSVVYIRKPLEVAVMVYCQRCRDGFGEGCKHTYGQVAVVLVEGHKVHRHIGGGSGTRKNSWM